MNDRLSPITRRLVLGGALLGAIIVALGPHAPAVHAGESSQISPPVVIRVAAPAKAGQGDTAPAAKPPAPSSAKSVAPDKPGPGMPADEVEDDDAANVTIDRHGIRVDEGTGTPRKKHVIVGLGGKDREYDSIDEFFKQDPGLFAMVAGIVFIVFLTPVLVIALVIWYKLRKSRMLNETMLQLAERGVIAPAEAMQTLQSGRTAAVASALTAQMPLAEQVRLLRNRAVWSDLRRGVILGAVGLAFCAYSMFDDQTPNWIGLILLFLGVGYTLLWFFEDRQLAAPADFRPPPPPAGGA
jgi:hypothetical protein